MKRPQWSAMSLTSSTSTATLLVKTSMKTRIWKTRTKKQLPSKLPLRRAAGAWAHLAVVPQALARAPPTSARLCSRGRLAMEGKSARRARRVRVLLPSRRRG